MSTPLNISETNERGPYSGAGPHSIATSIAAGSAIRFAAQVGVIIKDATTSEVYYSGTMAVTKYDATNLALSTPVHRYCKTGLPWTNAGVPQVSFAAVITSDELVGNVTIPGGYDVEITYRIEGIYT